MDNNITRRVLETTGKCIGHQVNICVNTTCSYVHSLSIVRDWCLLIAAAAAKKILFWFRAFIRLTKPEWSGLGRVGGEQSY